MSLINSSQQIFVEHPFYCSEVFKVWLAFVVLILGFVKHLLLFLR